MVDDLAIIRSMNTDAINHEPAITFIQTGRQVAGRPCIGSWLAYGLGSMNQDLPTFVVMNAEKSHPKSGQQAISAKLWSSDSSRRNTPASGCAAGLSRCCMSRILTASHQAYAGRCSTD